MSLLLSSWELWTSGLLIFALGVLLTAGGGGGGGVFVTIMVVVAGFSGHEAVPLAKFIIFWGAIATFIANTWRTPQYLDAPLIRALAPMSLAGTLIGISLNGALSEPTLMGLLSLLLSAIFVRMVQLTIRKKTRREIQRYQPRRVSEAQRALRDSVYSVEFNAEQLRLRG